MLDGHLDVNKEKLQRVELRNERFLEELRRQDDTLCGWNCREIESIGTHNEASILNLKQTSNQNNKKHYSRKRFLPSEFQLAPLLDVH